MLNVSVWIDLRELRCCKTGGQQRPHGTTEVVSSQQSSKLLVANHIVDHSEALHGDVLDARLGIIYKTKIENKLVTR